ncbi:Hypothetical predicted protein, partial [Paramuricea clavata]
GVGNHRMGNTSKDTSRLTADFHDNAVLGVYGRTELGMSPTNTDSLRSQFPTNLALQTTTDKFYPSNVRAHGKLEQNRNNPHREIPRRT